MVVATGAPSETGSLTYHDKPPTPCIYGWRRLYNRIAEGSHCYMLLSMVAAGLCHTHGV